MLVICVDEKRAVAKIDIVLAADFSWADEDGLGGGIGGRDEADLAGNLVACADDDPVFLSTDVGIATEADVGLLVEEFGLLDGIAEAVVVDVVRAPVLIGIAKDEARAVGGPNEAGKRAGDDIGQLFARGEIAEMHLEVLGAIIVIRIGHELPIRTDDEVAELEVVLALGEFVLIQDELLITSGSGLPVVAAILRAFGEGGPVDPVAILLRHAAVVFLDAAFHLLEERFHQRLLILHVRLEVAILRFEVGQHVLVFDLRVTGIAQPVPGVLDRDTVMGELERSLRGDGGLGGDHGLFRGLGRSAGGGYESHRDEATMRRV